MSGFDLTGDVFIGVTGPEIFGLLTGVPITALVYGLLLLFSFYSFNANALKMIVFYLACSSSSNRSISSSVMKN